MLSKPRPVRARFIISLAGIVLMAGSVVVGRALWQKYQGDVEWAFQQGALLGEVDTIDSGALGDVKKPTRCSLGVNRSTGRRLPTVPTPEYAEKLHASTARMHRAYDPTDKRSPLSKPAAVWGHPEAP